MYIPFVLLFTLAFGDLLVKREGGVEFLDPRRQVMFNNTLATFALTGQCFPNVEFVNKYLENLRSTGIGIFENRTFFKRETDVFLGKHPHWRQWDQEYDINHNICLGDRPNHLLYSPMPDPPIANLSVAQTLEQYPYLKQNLNPRRLNEMFNTLPLMLKNKLMMRRYSAINGKTTLVQYPLVRVYINLGKSELQILMDSLQDIPNVDFILHGRDQLHQQFVFNTVDFSFPVIGNAEFDGYYQLYKRILIEMPAFMSSKDLQSGFQFNKLLMIDRYMCQESWSNVIAEVGNLDKIHSWQSKSAKAYWRGDPSGIMYGYNDIYSNIPIYFTRLQSIILSQRNPDLIDAKFVRDDKLDFQRMEKMGISNFMAPRASYEDHLKHKYLISVDGWTAAWLRVPWIMYSNSVLLKQESLKVQWFSQDMEPDVHYINIKHDLSDLLDKIRWLNQNDQVAKKVIKEANAFVRSRLMPYNLRADLTKMLKEYAEYQKLQLSLQDQMNVMVFGVVVVRSLYPPWQLRLSILLSICAVLFVCGLAGDQFRISRNRRTQNIRTRIPYSNITVGYPQEILTS